MAKVLAEPVAVDLAELLPQLAARGFQPRHSEYAPNSFGNYLVDFSDPTRSFRVIRERSQYMIHGDQEVLTAAGLWRAFDDKKEFESAILSCLGRA